MDSVFVTGATGFVGAHVARVLLDEGFRVRALARRGVLRPPLDALPIEWVPGDVLDRAALKRGVGGCRAVLHCAADYRLWVPDPGAMHLTNVEGTKRVLEEAGRAGVERIVYTSSVATIPSGGGAASDETRLYSSPGGVPGPYKRSKVLAERAALESVARGLPVVIVNPSAPMGPGDARPTPTGKIVVDFLNRRMPAYMDTGLNVVHVGDVARGHLLALRRGRIGERYILGGENLRLKDLLDGLARLTGLPAPRFKLPYAAAMALAGVEHVWGRLTGRPPRAPLDGVRLAAGLWFYDHRKAREELDYRPRPAAEALADAARWFVEAGFARRPPRAFPGDAA